MLGDTREADSEGVDMIRNVAAIVRLMHEMINRIPKRMAERMRVKKELKFVYSINTHLRVLQVGKCSGYKVSIFLLLV